MPCTYLMCFKTTNSLLHVSFVRYSLMRVRHLGTCSPVFNILSNTSANRRLSTQIWSPGVRGSFNPISRNDWYFSPSSHHCLAQSSTSLAVLGRHQLDIVSRY